MKFLALAKVYICSGIGGAGCVSLRRENSPRTAGRMGRRPMAPAFPNRPRSRPWTRSTPWLPRSARKRRPSRRPPPVAAPCWCQESRART